MRREFDDKDIQEGMRVCLEQARRKCAAIDPVLRGLEILKDLETKGWVSKLETINQIRFARQLLIFGVAKDTEVVASLQEDMERMERKLDLAIEAQLEMEREGEGS